MRSAKINLRFSKTNPEFFSVVFTRLNTYKPEFKKLIQEVHCLLFTRRIQHVSDVEYPVIRGITVIFPEEN